MELLTFAWYSIVFLVAGIWILSMLVPETAPTPIRRAVGILLVVGALGAGYLMTYSLPPTADCQAGESHSPC